MTRAGEGVMYDGLTVSYEFLSTTAPGKQMSPVVATINLRRITGPEDFVRHEGEEFVYVISGSVEAHFENDSVVKLSRGDSICFDARVGHAYVSTSRALARIVGVMSEASVNVRRRISGAAAAPAGRSAAAAQRATRARSNARSSG